MDKNVLYIEYIYKHIVCFIYKTCHIMLHYNFYKDK